LSAGQREEIDRVWQAYPQLRDDAFVGRHREEWLKAQAGTSTIALITPVSGSSHAGNV
jgi:hypothetical protein